ncbi:DUF397 domain-containing protein [Streptomyces malaysiensis subsp. malaysiensis]|uniref:DUF397 domain-containing protein n=1 Tax=Streptomyces malaysiensis TaxID=92644 RepID=UPI0024BF6375|nr:DUF397 domain-containing protein [Streptomyces sp. NA07423]WHX20443.1 DUF397 domain-containing protein [Streptomyces sp. NA07423]
MRAAIGLSPIQWRKSSYSNVDGGNCVEVADGFSGAVLVRDSKKTTGDTLLLSDKAWFRFVESLKNGSL